MKSDKTLIENAKQQYISLDKNGKKILENVFGEETFVQGIMERVNTVDDVFKELGKSRSEFNKQYDGIEENIKNYRITELIAEVFNEDWIPDFTDSNQYKYTPYFDLSDGGFSYYGYVTWGSGSTVGLRLVFKNSDIIEGIMKKPELLEVYRLSMGVK